jgi:hypothetical protein
VRAQVRLQRGRARVRLPADAAHVEVGERHSRAEDAARSLGAVAMIRQTLSGE